MNAQQREAMVDALAEVAHTAEPPPLSPALAKAIVERALDDASTAGSAHTREPRKRSVPGMLGWAAAAVVLLGVGLTAGYALSSFLTDRSGAVARRSSTARETTSPGAEGAERDRPTRFSLPSGDELAATPGARFRIGGIGPERRIAVDQGTVSFDVRPLMAGESFTVEAPHLVARVVGTVFTVEALSDRSIVRVYEGHVEVAHDGQTDAVLAGSSITVFRDPRFAGSFTCRTDARDPVCTALGADPLAAVADAAADARSRAARSAEVDSVPEPLPGVPGSDARRSVRQPTLPAESLAAALLELEDVGQRIADGDVESAPAAESGAEALLEPEHARRSIADGDVESAPVASSESGARASLGPEDVRRWIAEGEVDRALAAARAALDAGEPAGPWHMVEGDALRARGRFQEAAEAYEAAAEDVGLRVRAGYILATLRVDHAGDPDGALRALDQYGCAATGSPLEERALLLRVRLLSRAGRRDEASAEARRYLTRFPNTPHREQMQSLVR